MNIREGNIGAQEGAAAAGIALGALGIFSAPFDQGEAHFMSGAAGILLALGIFFLARQAMGKLGSASLFELLCRGLGETAGRIAAMFFIGAFIGGAGELLGRFMGMLSTFAFPDAAPWMLLCYLAPAAGALAWIGLEGIGRTARIFCFPLLLCLLIGLLLGLNQYEPFRLFPWPADGAGVLLIGFREIGLFLPALLALLIAGRGLQSGKSIARGGILAAVFGGGGVILARLCLNMAYGHEALAVMDAPLYRLTMSVRSGGYFPRLDQLLLFGWTAGGILAAGLCQYAGALLWCQVFRQRDIRPAVLLMAGLSAAFCLLTQREIPWLLALREFFGYWGWILIGAPVVLAAFLGLFRRPLEHGRADGA